MPAIKAQALTAAGIRSLTTPGDYSDGNGPDAQDRPSWQQALASADHRQRPVSQTYRGWQRYFPWLSVVIRRLVDRERPTEYPGALLGH